ncbi:MAG: nucleotidyltransferase domain-containing protein [Deltaproteobacteria bacterium]|nr:MAG: nucleotidyltransferase domain-containing protein [Deltaproteobacteria bacterium]
MAVDIAEARAHLERTQRQRDREGEERASRLRARLPEAAEMLRARGAERVLLFGSLAEGHSGRASDVDLAVEGLDPKHYFACLADLMALFGGPVDLVRLEEASPSLRDRVEAVGVPL